MFKGDGIFLVIVVGQDRGSFESNQITAKMIEKAKSLQQRYWQISIFKTIAMRSK